MKLVALLLLLAACGGDDDGITPSPDASPDAEPASDAGPYTLTFPEAQSLGGPVLDAPRIVPIFFAGDATQADFEDYLAMLPGSSYWAAVTAEYGIGDLTLLSTVVTSDPPPSNDFELADWLSAHLDDPSWPAFDPQTMYTVILPPGAGFDGACSEFLGYHSETQHALHGNVVYALIPRCPDGNGFTGFQLATLATSHEYIEAASDPYPFSSPAYQAVDDDHAVWGVVPAAELADLCSYLTISRAQLLGPYMVQRSWSNLAAAEHHDPCVPARDEPYVAVIPRLTTRVDLRGVSTLGVRVPVGATVTVPVDVISDAPTEAWPLEAAEVGVIFQEAAPTLELHLSQDSARPGDPVTLTITRLADGELGGTEIFLSARLPASARSLWWVYVDN